MSDISRQFVSPKARPGSAVTVTLTLGANDASDSEAAARPRPQQRRAGPGQWLLMIRALALAPLRSGRDRQSWPDNADFGAGAERVLPGRCH